MHPSAAAHLAQVPPYVPGRPTQAPRVSLASNESPLGPSPRATAAAVGAALCAARYPVDGSPELACALARRHGLDPAGVRVTNGATEGISLLCRAFVGEVVVTSGTFPAYARSALAAGSTVREVPRRGWHADLDALLAACGPQTRLLFLANPDNPTGTLHGMRALAAWLARLPQHIVVVLDEAYIEYVAGSGERDGDALALRGLHPNLVVLRSFSKAHGLAALRVGWLAASPALAATLDRVRDPFNVNAVGVAAALAATADLEHLGRVVAANTAQRSSLRADLCRRGLSPVPSAANFLCVPVLGTGTALAAALAGEGVAVRALDGWGIAGAIRITLGTDEEHRLLLRALDAVLPAHARLAQAA